MSPQNTRQTPSATTLALAGGKPDWAKSDRQLGRELRLANGQPAPRRLWPWGLAVVAVVGIGLAYAYSTTLTPADTTASAPVAVALVMQVNTDELEILAPRTLERRVRATGTLAPWRNTQLSSQTGGEVRDVAVRPGDRVAEGALLVQLDIETLTLDLNQARSSERATQAQLSLAELQLDRVRALVERGVTTSASLDEARNAVTQARASLDALEDQVATAELRLRHASVRAPFAGVVAARSVEPGQYVGPGTPLISLVDLTTVEMQANAAVADGALLREGQVVEITVDGVESRSFEGVVTRINPVAQEGTRTVPVYITIDNIDGILLGGMFATAQVVVEDAVDAFAVPTVALRSDAAGTYVLQIIDGVLTRASVDTPGIWSGGLTQISNGPGAGDTVITAPLPSLRAGDTVEIVGN